MVPPVCNTMRTYTIKPLDFSEPQTDEQSELTADGTVIIICPTEPWNLDPQEGDMFRVAVLNHDTHHWDDRFDLDSTPYPTFEAAVEAANESHRKAVEKGVDPARVSVEPIGEQHKDGQPHLTNEGWVVWWSPAWWVCDESGNRLTCADEGPFVADHPTLVITIHP